MLNNIIQFILNGVGNSDLIKERFLKIAIDNGFVEYNKKIIIKNKFLA